MGIFFRLYVEKLSYFFGKFVVFGKRLWCFGNYDWSENMILSYVVFGKYLSVLRLCVVIFFFCLVDLLDDGVKEFNLEKINGDVIEFYG